MRVCTSSGSGLNFREGFLPAHSADAYKTVRPRTACTARPLETKGDDSMLLMENRALLDAYRRGEPEALARVYRHYAPSVERLVTQGFSFSSSGETMRFTGYTHAFERQEILQETFMRIFSEKVRMSYSGVQPLGPYLLGIARNLVIDDFRRRKRELALFVPEDAEGRTLDASNPADLQGAPLGDWTRERRSPEREADHRALQTLLQEFLESLTEEHKRLVELHCVESLSQAAVAQELGVDRNNVRKQIKEVRIKLLRFMKSRGRIQSLDASELFHALAFCLSPSPL